MLTLIVYEIVSVLALIVYQIVSVLTLIVYKIMSVLTLIVYKIVTLLTLIVKRCLSDKLICLVDQQKRLSCTWIDTGLRDYYGVGHSLHIVLLNVSPTDH